MKKRIISIILMACMLLTMLPVTAVAADDVTFTATITVGVSEADCTFKVLTEPADGNPGTVQIGDGTNAAIAQDSTGELTIPTRVEYSGNTYTVTVIGNEAFNRCYDLVDGTKGLTGLSFEADSKLTTIGNNAFFWCSGLTGNLTIPDSVTTIGNSAFQLCSGLNGNLTLPASVTYIGSNAFAFCSNLTGGLTIPEGVINVGHAAFVWCRNLTSLTLPAGLKTIGEQAFNGCSGFTGNLTLPAGVTTIGDSAFSGCIGFDGTLTIPASVTTINQDAFSGCSGLTGLTLPAGVTTIGDHAFRSCGFTGNLTLPANVADIGDDAFAYCSSLASVTLLRSTAPSVGFNSFNLSDSHEDDYSIFVPYDGTGYDTGDWTYVSRKISSYNISGTIKGSDTDAGIPATLQLKNSSGANVGSSVNANASGAYIIPIPVTSAGTGYTIDVSCTGYESGTISAFDVTNANVTGKDLTLTAITYTITYDANGGSVTPASATTGANGKLATLPVPNRANHRFDGWFTAASGGTPVTTDTVFTANRTIYAQWTYQGGGGGSSAPAPATDTFTFTPSQLAGMISSNRAIEIENGLQIIAKPEDIPRAEGDTIVIKASEIKSPDSLNAFYLAYPNQQGILKGYSVTFSSENNGQSRDITQLNGEITLKFKLAAEEVKGIDPSTLVVYKQGDNGAVTPLQATYDWENNTLSVNTDHLCNFYLMGQEGIPAQRLSGANRYETAAAISRQGWAKAESVILASGEDFPDALVATALAGYKDAPVLLTAKDKLTPETLQEIQRLSPKSIYILGGPGVISKGLEDQLAANYKIQRIFGESRYETAVKLGELLQAEKAKAKLGDAADTVILATGLNYPDSLAAAPFAGRYILPILFTGKGTLHEKTAGALTDWGIQKVILIGGEGVISENVENTLKELKMSVTRVSGEDRYLTSLAIAQYFEVYGADSPNNSSTRDSAKCYTQAALATGESYPDALAGAALAVKEKMPLLLVEKSAVHQEIKEYLKGKQLKKIYVYGGQGAVTDNIKNEISVSKNK